VDTPLRILHLEGNVMDAGLVSLALQREGIQHTMSRVNTREEFSAAVHAGTYDIILADAPLPAFDSPSPLQIATVNAPHIPFVIIADISCEERAIEALQSGATDYVLKQRLDRLGPVVHRALREARDRRERQEVETALRQNEEKFHSLFQNMQEGVALSDLVYDRDGKPVDYRIVDVNPAYCRHTGIPGERAIGSMAGALYGAGLPPYLDIFAKVALTGEPVHFESYFAPLGKHFRISVFSPRHGWFATIFEDITERMLMQGRLLRAQRMEGMATVVGGIVHEFSDILNNVLGFNTLTRKYAHDREKSLKYSQAIEKSVLRGDEITQRLLAFARVENRALEPVDIAGLVEEVANRIQREFPANVILLKRIDPGLPPVLGVRTELFEAAMNLCLNARDAILQNPTTGGHGTVTIDAERAVVTDELASTLMLRAGSVCLLLRFADTGIGIREEIADRIFDPFFTTKEPGHGTGLGLSIVYTVVRGHHGTITVDSTVGRGSTFRIYLPVFDLTREQTLQNGNAKVPAAAELVLLVDDEQPMLEFGRDILADHGYRVITATNGVEAIALYREHAKDVALVILDLIMPRMDGGQTYIELKKINKSVKAMFCTGYTSDEVISSLLQEEHLRAVRKPFQIEEFVGTVRAVLDDGQ